MPILGTEYTKDILSWLKVTDSNTGEERPVDLFMDGYDIQTPQLYLVCLGAFLLAAKILSCYQHEKLFPFVRIRFPRNK